MPRDLNYMSHGGVPVKDNDLLDAQVRLGETLPWLRFLLEELQFLRVAHAGRPDPDDLSDRDDHIEYLESILDKIGAAYEPR